MTKSISTSYTMLICSQLIVNPCYFEMLTTSSFKSHVNCVCNTHDTCRIHSTSLTNTMHRHIDTIDSLSHEHAPNSCLVSKESQKESFFFLPFLPPFPLFNSTFSFSYFSFFLFVILFLFILKISTGI